MWKELFRVPRIEICQLTVWPLWIGQSKWIAQAIWFAGIHFHQTDLFLKLCLAGEVRPTSHEYWYTLQQLQGSALRGSGGVRRVATFARPMLCPILITVTLLVATTALHWPKLKQRLVWMALIANLARHKLTCRHHQIAQRFRLVSKIGRKKERDREKKN